MNSGASKRAVPEITIDARWLYTGVGTYTFNLISRFPDWGHGLSLRAVVARENAQRIAPFCNRLVISDAPIYTLREQVSIPWAARGTDLLHVPHYNAPLFYSGKLVVSIHDLVHITDPDYRKRPIARTYAHTMLHLAVRRADHLITVSQFSKNEIVKRLGVLPSKISVIYEGVDPKFRYCSHDQAYAKVSSDLPLRHPYILYVGNLKPHKNLGRLFQAFAALRGRRKLDVDLLVVSRDAVSQRELAPLAAELGITNAVHFRNDIEDDLLPWVYSGAQVLVMPSLIEGFGLPVLEAMACGTPVVSSNAASLPEVGGDAVEYFDPHQVEDMASAMHRVLTLNDLRAQMCDKGLKQAARFSWNDSTQQHCDVYRRVLRCEPLSGACKEGCVI